MNGHKKRTLRKRNDILNATKYLIFNQGLSNLTIQMIRKKAEVSQVTIYNIFNNKHTLINEAIKSHAAHSVNEIVDILEKDQPAEEKLRNYFSCAFKQNIQSPKTKEVQEYIFSGNDKELEDFVVNLYTKSTPSLIKMYEECKKVGLIRQEITAEHFLNLLNIFTRINVDFYKLEENRSILINSIVNSFK